jgi:hypothetical protein
MEKIKNFEKFFEATDMDTVVNITSPVMFPIRMILASKRNKVLEHATIRFASPDTGSTIWFELDHESNITIQTSSTEEDIVQKLDEVFNKWTSIYSVGARETRGSETVKMLEEDPVFGTWWKKAVHKYRGSINGKQYGI